MAKTFLSVTSNAESHAASVDEAGQKILGANYGEARRVFREMRDLLIANVGRNIDAQDFIPLAPATVAYKRRYGLDSRVLIATGNTWAGLDGSSGATFAKAMRGNREWYIFLHDRGKGTSHWSGKRYPQRQVFYISPDTEAKAVSMYEELLETIVSEVGAV